MAIEEKDSAQGLILRGGCYLLVCRQIGDVCLDFRHTHFGRMPFFMIKDIAFAPIDIGLFGAVGIMLGTNGIAKLIEQLFIFIEGGRAGWRE
jgi:hypothetical protein